MKKRNKMLAMSLVVSGMLLVGCGTVQESKLEKIGLDAAKEVALKEAGIVDEKIVFTSSELDSKNDKEYYDIDFIADGHKYEYDIDALTGIVIESKKPVIKEEKEEMYTKEEMEEKVNELWELYEQRGEEIEKIEEEMKTQLPISDEEAKEIALAQIPGATENDIYGFEVDRDDGRISYEGSIVYNEMEYDFEIDGYSGAIREWDAESIYD